MVTFAHAASEAIKQANKMEVSNGLAPLTASDLGAKALTVVLPDGTRFSMALFPGTSEKAFGTAIATRAKLPLQYHDGTESFFVTVGGPNGLVVPLCADGLPDGQTLTMHVNPLPPPVVRFAAPGGDATPAEAPKTPEAEPARPGLKRASTITLKRGLSWKDHQKLTLNFTQGLAVVRLQSAYRAIAAKRRAEERKQLREKFGDCGVYMIDGCYSMATRLGIDRLVERWLPGYVSKYDKIEDHDDDEISGMAKMSRMSTDLANERTLLAWIRTILAIMRTAFATLGIEGVNPFWAVVQLLTVIMMCGLMVAAAVTGIYRYYKIARITALKNIPASFGKNRIPLWPVNAILASSVGTVAIAAVLHGFEK